MNINVTLLPFKRLGGAFYWPKFLLVILVAALSAVNTKAQLITEPFNYTASATNNLATQSSGAWVMLNSGDSIIVESGSLSYTGLPASAGNKITYGGSGSDSYRAYTSQNSGTVYCSFLLNIASLGSLNATGGYTIGLVDGTTSNFAATLWLRLSGSGFNIGINPRTTAANTAWVSGTLTTNTTYLVVIANKIIAGTGNDSVKVWVNPALATFGGSEPTPYNTSAVNTGGTDLTTFQRVLLRQDNTSATPGVIQIDEMRVATSWALAVPSGCTLPSVSAISNSGPICDTTSLQLNVTGAGTAPLSYNWTGPSGFTSSDEDPLVATPHQGYYVVTVSNACGSANDSTLANVTASQSWYVDADGDGYGDGSAVVACTQPTGYVNQNGDCDNNNNAVHPGATEICNGIDDDCDTFIDDADPGVTGQGTYYSDTDNDGYGTGAPILACVQPPNTSTNNTDCNDNNPFVSPGELEDACGNNTDDDCDTEIDEGCGTYTYYLDGDADGFGTLDSFIVVFDTVPPSGYSINDDDCNDVNAAVNPSAQEICNGIDDDCDTFIDNADPSVTGQSTYYTDTDVDGYGAGSAILSCTAPPNTSTNNLDCDDGNSAVNPGATEICNGIDDDCDTFIDNADSSVTGQTAYYVDGDGDGYGSGSATLSCTAISGSVANNTDCNDTIAAINPGATEVCNGIDDDCDSFIDDADPGITGQGTYYNDLDGDGYGAGTAIQACIQPGGTVLNNTDCNDTIAAINPGVTEVASNGVDDDCDGLIDELGVGDIMIIGAHFDATDQIAFVTWVDLTPGTTIRFTDNSWNGTVLASNENTTVWTTSVFVPAGTVIVGSFPTTTSSWDIGTSTSALNGLSADGEAIFAYQGLPASPSFVFGLNVDGAGWQTSGTVNNNSSYLPSVLNVTEGNVSIAEFDNVQYNGARSGFTTSQYKSLVLTPANWITDDAGTLFPTLNSTDFFDINYLSTGTVASPICVTSTDATPISIPYTTTITFAGGNVFTAQLSNATGSFASPTVLGTLAATTSGVINGSIPSSIPAGTGYRIRVVASSPNGPGADNGSDIIINKITVSASNNGPICAGQQLNLFASGGTGYAWTGPNGFVSSAQNPVIPVALIADSGDYTVIITDANGCSDTVTTIASVQDCGCFPPSLSAAKTDVSCFGFNDGTIDLTVSGIATPPYTFSWSNGAITEDLSSIAAGTYTVVVTDSLGCSDSLTIVITEPELLSASATGQNPICYGEATGSVNATITGGVAPYIYSWSNGVVTEDLTGLVEGIYTLTVTDAHGCTATTMTELDNPPQVVVSLDNAFTLTCDSSSLGTINISVSNDTLTNPNNPGLLISEFLANPSGSDSPFEWVELVATKKINFSLNPYTVIVANNGNATTKGWTLGFPPASTVGTYAFEISSGVVNPGDVVYVGGSSMAPTGVKLRVINTSTTGGDGGIGGPSSSGVFGNGSTADGIAVFSNAASILDSNSVPVDAIFYGTTIGTAAILSEGNYAGYTLPVNDIYSGGYLTPTSFIAPDASVTNTVIKATGAYNSSSGIYTTRTWTSSLAFSNQATSISVTSVNSYQWSNGTTDQDLTNILPGTYTVTVTTQLGCQLTDTFTLATPVEPQPLVSPGDSVLCNGQELYLTVSDEGGFVSGYPQGTTVEWLGIVSGLSPTDSVSSINGPYFIAQVSVPGGCVGTSDTVVVLTRSVGVNPVITNESCGNGSGSIVVTVTGGVAPYRYVWSDGMNTIRDITTNDDVDSIYNLSAGNYQVVVYDNEGGVVAGEPSCNSGIVPFVIMSQSGAQAYIASSTNILCNGLADGSAQAAATGGTEPYSYLWSNGSTDALIQSLSAGLYIVTVTDANGCSDTASVTITEPDSIQLSVTAVDVSVCGGNDGSASVIVSGGTSPFTYSWFDENVVQIGTDSSGISGLVAGLYYVQVFDANGCNSFTTFNINQTCGGTILNVKAYLEGYATSFGAPTLPMSAALYWQGVSGDDTQSDSIRIELRDQNSSSVVVESVTVLLDINGNAVANFSSSVTGGTYWIAVVHRSSIETYSSTPITLAAVNTYDFTISQSMAYGDNLKDLFGDGSVWAMFTGDIFDSNNFDIGQDGFIDVFDYLLLDQDIQQGQSGYYITDLNGDGFVDVFDYLLVDPNIQAGVSKITPP